LLGNNLAMEIAFAKGKLHCFRSAEIELIRHKYDIVIAEVSKLEGGV